MNKVKKIVSAIAALTLFGLTINISTNKKTKKPESQIKPQRLRKEYKQKKKFISSSMEENAKTGLLSNLPKIKTLGKVEQKLIKSKKLNIKEEKRLIEISKNRTRYYSSVLIRNAIVKNNDQLLSRSTKFIQLEKPILIPSISSKKADLLLIDIKTYLDMSTNLLFGAKLEKIVKEIEQLVPKYKKLADAVIKASKIKLQSKQIIEIATVLLELEKEKEKKKKQKRKQELEKIGERVQAKEMVGSPSEQFYFIDKEKSPETPLFQETEY